MTEPDKDALQQRVRALFEARRFVEAEEQLETYLSRHADDIEALYLLGTVRQTLKNQDAAAACFIKVLQASPQHIHARYNLGIAYAAQGAYEDALAQLRQLEDRTPKSATLFYQIGVVLRILGRLDEARDALRHALQLNPDYPAAYYVLSGINRYDDKDDADITNMLRLLEKGGLSDDDLTKLNFALAKVYEDVHDYDQAFAYLVQGNRLRRQRYDYDVAEHEGHFHRFMEVFTSEFFEQRSDYGVSDNTPIFIVGMPRSGTSLVEQILASHPQVYGGGELEDLVQVIMRHSEVLNADIIKSLSAADCADMANRYLAAVRQYSGGAPRVTDKRPLNFQFVGMIRLLFPNARVIHCRRDPLDTCLAIYKQNFTVTHKFAFDLVELGRYYRAYSQLMDHWQRVLPGFIYDNRYEDLVADQENGTRRLLDFCDLSWDDACLKFYQTERPVSTASVVQVRKPMYRSSVNKWRNYERHLEPLKQALAGAS